MSEKDEKNQSVEPALSQKPQNGPGPASSAAAEKREARLAEALRSNLRRRKSAAKKSKDG
ncbi:MAG: hypothetical protein ABJN98_01225 [Roseibium sp.]